MKLKLDENGNAVLQDGKPVYIKDDGSEIALDAKQLFDTLSNRNAEAKGHREAKEQAEAKLKAYAGIDDPAKALEALKTVANLDDKKLIDAGEVEKVKAEAKKTYDEQLARIQGELDSTKQQFNTAVIGGEFARSQVIKDKLILPADIAQQAFGKHFSMDENGKLVAKFADGNPIYSGDPNRAGELATFDEALTQIIDKYPHKDNILRGSGATGGGATGSQDGNPNHATKSYADCKTDADKVKWLQSQP